MVITLMVGQTLIARRLLMRYTCSERPCAKVCRANRLHVRLAILSSFVSNKPNHTVKLNHDDFLKYRMLYNKEAKNAKTETKYSISSLSW